VASSLCFTQQVTLGGTFLTAAKNYTVPGNTESKYRYFNAEMEASAICRVGATIDPLCSQSDGIIESNSMYWSKTATTSYSWTCCFPKAKFNSFEDKVVVVLKGHSYTFNFSMTLDGSTSDIHAVSGAPKGAGKPDGNSQVC
jgi:hypothetical protein